MALATIAGLLVAFVAFVLAVFVLADAASGDEAAASEGSGVAIAVVCGLAAPAGLWAAAQQRRSRLALALAGGVSAVVLVLALWWAVAG